METITQPAHLVTAEPNNITEWVRLIFSDVQQQPEDLETIALLQSGIWVKEQKVPDDCITALVRKFQTDGRKRRRQCSLLEYCLAQLQDRYQIQASPSPRVLVSDPERHYLDMSQVRFLQTISSAMSFIETAIKVPVTDKWENSDFSMFVLRLIFEQRVLNRKQLEDVVARRYQLAGFGQHFWLEQNDQRILITSDFADCYRLFATLKNNPLSCRRLCKWMSKEIFHDGLSLSLLCKAGALRARLNHGVFFAELSGQQIQTTLLPTMRWRQLLGQDVRIAEESPIHDALLPIRTKRQWKQKTVKSYTKSACSQYESLSNRLKPVFDESGQPRKTELTKLRLWLDNDENAENYSWEWLLTGWCYWMIVHGGKRKDKLRKSSISRYAQFARPLLESLGSQDVWENSSEQWFIVIEQAVNKGGKAIKSVAVELFASFLVLNGIAPDLDISDIDLPIAHSNVDANMMAPAEIELILITLRRYNNELARIARLLLCFGFACGLRRNEVLGLKKQNLRLCKSPYLALRHTSTRTIKSARGRRNIPFELFWPEEEYQLLLEYSSSPAVQTAALLFHDQPLALEAMALLTALMKEVTGQPASRFHHLRHSFANWFFWLLHLPRIDLNNTPVFFRHPWLNPHRSTLLRQLLGLSTDLVARRDLHTLAIMLGHSTPIVTMHSYIHISDIVNAALISPLTPRKGTQTLYRPVKPDEDTLQVATDLVRQAIQKQKNRTVRVYPLCEIGQAIYQLSGSRHILRDERVTSSLLGVVDAEHRKGSLSPKMHAVMKNVMRKKVPLRVITRFKSWLSLLDDRQWGQFFTLSQVEEIVHMTDPGKDFLFICRSLVQIELLCRWLEFLEINPSEISYRLTLATRCHWYCHSENPLQQIASELENDYQAGALKNLSAPKGRAKKQDLAEKPIDKDTLSNQKYFTCEVHVRWDDIGSGVKRRNQALIGVLKVMWLSWRLQTQV